MCRHSETLILPYFNFHPCCTTPAVVLDDVSPGVQSTVSARTVPLDVAVEIGGRNCSNALPF